jgi:hypothetical protein
VNDRLRAALARRIASHNKLVRATTAGGILAIIVMWLAIYFIAQWLLLFLASAVRGTEAGLPVHFRGWFLAGVALWFGVFWFTRWRSGPPPATEKGISGTFADFLLLPPRMTLGVARNLDNLVKLEPHEIDAASLFLARLVRAGKIPVASLPVELPGEDAPRDHLIGALRLLDLVYIRQPKDGAACIVPSNPQKLLAFL